MPVAVGVGLIVGLGVFVIGNVGIAVRVGGRVGLALIVWVGVGVGITLLSGAIATAISPEQ